MSASCFVVRRLPVYLCLPRTARERLSHPAHHRPPHPPNTQHPSVADHTMNPPAPRKSGGHTHPQVTTARTGIIYQGAASSSAGTPAINNVPNTVTYAPRYANYTVSLLNHPPVLDNNKSATDRKRRCGELLDRLISPLFCQPMNNPRDDAYDACEEVTTDDNQENDTRTDAKKRKTGTSSLPAEAAVGETKDRLVSLQRELEQYRRQNEQILERRMSVYNSLVELHECYETGLDGIARANDLRNVPDNVMMDRPSHATK